MLKRLTHASVTQRAIGTIGAWYLSLVWKTSRFTLEPPDIFQTVEKDLPVIVAMWHGQHFLMPFAKGRGHRVKSLISMHRDGEINAIAAEKLGVGTIRGSGAHNGEFHRKGGTAAFRAMLDALADGCNIALTADVPKVARRAGLGIVKLAQHSGRLIFPAAIATSRRIELNSWDRTVINLPFSRGAVIAGDPIHVPENADDVVLEQARRAVEDGLNKVTARAYQVADDGG